MTHQTAESAGLRPAEGLHVLHLYYQLDRERWDLLSPDDRRRELVNFTELAGEIRRHPDTQLLTQVVVTPRADLGLMLLTPDLEDLIAFEKRLSASFAHALQPSFSYFSLTERSEYFPTREEHIQRVLKTERGLQEDTPEFTAALAQFDEYMEKYVQRRVWPQLPDWPVICFYPMAKRRSPEQNWYQLSFEQRAKLMATHGGTGRRYSGKILQLITGSTGLDDMEWGVTLLSRSTEDIKAIVYEMRYDEVSARYAEFGEFYIGLQQPLDKLFKTLDLL